MLVSRTTNIKITRSVVRLDVPFPKMDKKAISRMVQSDMSRIYKEYDETLNGIKSYKDDMIKYMNALLSQIATDAGPLLAKTPKMTRKRVAANKIKAIPENEVVEADEVSDSSYSLRSLRSSRMDSGNLELSEAQPARAKRGASIKAANSIKQQQSASLHTKLRRPSERDSDAPLISRVCILIFCI